MSLTHAETLRRCIGSPPDRLATYDVLRGAADALDREAAEIERLRKALIAAEQETARQRDLIAKAYQRGVDCALNREQS